MIDIQSPDKIKRGDVLKGQVFIDLDKETRIRGVLISFDNMLSYSNPCTNNFSGWRFQHPHQVFNKDAFRTATIPFKFDIPKEAPPTYRGKSLNSSWQINVKIDIPLALDVHAKKDVEVER